MSHKTGGNQKSSYWFVGWGSWVSLSIRPISCLSALPLESDDLMGRTWSDANGYFQVTGCASDFGPINTPDPYIYIEHKCPHRYTNATDPIQVRTRFPIFRNSQTYVLQNASRTECFRRFCTMLQFFLNTGHAERWSVVLNCLKFSNFSVFIRNFAHSLAFFKSFRSPRSFVSDRCDPSLLAFHRPSRQHLSGSIPRRHQLKNRLMMLMELQIIRAAHCVSRAAMFA